MPLYGIVYDSTKEYYTIYIPVPQSTVLYDKVLYSLEEQSRLDLYTTMYSTSE